MTSDDQTFGWPRWVMSLLCGWGSGTAQVSNEIGIQREMLNDCNISLDLTQNDFEKHFC